MSESKNIWTTLRGLAPSGMRGIVGLIVVVVAFLLGALLSGGGDTADDQSTRGHSTEVAAEPTQWTCSMHPQIKLPEPGKCPICFMDLIPLESGSDDGLGPRQLRLSETAKQLAQIETTPAKRAFAEAEVRMVGKIAYDETKLSYITAWVPGRLDRLYADYTGIRVNKGDHLVEIYSPELIAAQEELIQAEKAVTSLENTASTVLRSTAVATLEAARDKLRLFGLTEAQIKRAETTRETDEHLTIYAPIGGVVVKKDATEGMYVETGTRIYTIANLGKLWVMFEAYESDLTWLRFGQRVEFTSPSFPGEHFEAVISFIDPLVDPTTRTVRVRAVVDNQNGRLKPDMFVRGVVKSRVDSDGNIIDEYLADKWICSMHPQVVKDGPGKCDVCDMDLVRASSLGYVGETPSDGDAPLLIPVSAPLITGKRAVAYVEIPTDEGPLFEGREVELGPRAGDFYVVRSGISEGELVVSNGAFKIDSELQIQAKPSMMSLHSEPASPATLEKTESDAVREALLPVYAAYFAVQMALANDNLDGARKAAAGTAEEVEKVDMSLFSRSGHGAWMNAAEALTKQARRIKEARDMKVARDGFFFLSESIIGVHESFGHGGDDNYYLTHCPMARNGDGAYWLQEEDIVWNSFYGASMLRCGSIEDTLAPTSGGTGR